MWRLACVLVVARVSVAGCGSVPFGGSVMTPPLELCSSSPRGLSCEHARVCQCSMPNCVCAIQWGSPDLQYSHKDVQEVEVQVNASCASVRREGSRALTSVRITINSKGGASDTPTELLNATEILVGARAPRECFAPHASEEVAQCAVRAPLVPRRTVPNLAEQLKRLNNKLVSLEVTVGPGSDCRNAAECQSCDIDSAVFWVDADVRVWVHYTTVNDSLTRLLLGVVFAVVWVFIMSVPLVLWLRRRRAQARERMDALLVALPRSARGTSRRGARHLGVRTKPRRFKALKVTDWVAERGISRRQHGWVLATAQVARDAEAILQSDPGVLGRHAPNVVVAKLEEGWITIKRAAVRGQPRTLEFTEAHQQPLKDPAQVYDYVLITLPESVRYSEGVSGEIRIDVHGNILEWSGARDSEGFRAKVERLRQQIDRAHKPATFTQRRDRDEFSIRVNRQNLWQVLMILLLLLLITYREE
jgi:hypothetical protein